MIIKEVVIMAIESMISLDLESKEICNWLHSDQAEIADPDNILSEVDTQFDDSKVSALILNSDSLNDNTILLSVFHERKFKVLLKGTDREIAVLSSVKSTQYRVDVIFEAYLYIKNDMDESSHSELLSFFSNFQINAQSIQEDLMASENGLISKGIMPSDYKVVLIPVLKKIDEVTLFDSHDAFGQHVLDNPRYDVVEVEGNVTCKYPDRLVDSSKEILVENIEDVESVENAVEERAAELASTRDCNGMVTFNKRLATLFQFPEWKTEMENKEIRIGKCRIVKTKVPVVYHRTTKRALYAFVATPRSGENYLHKSVMDCIVSASISTGVVALLTGGLSITLSIAAWSSAFVECIKGKLSDGVRCIVHDLNVVTEKGEWKHGFA